MKGNCKFWSTFEKLDGCWMLTSAFLGNLRIKSSFRRWKDFGKSKSEGVMTLNATVKKLGCVAQ
jgi:hypothetical protein